MKRALAERAKQSLPQALRPPQHPSSNGDVPSIEQALSSSVTEPVTLSPLDSSSATTPIKIPRFNRATIKTELSGTSGSDANKDRETKSAVSPPSPRVPKNASTGDSNHAPRRPSIENVASRKNRLPSAHKVSTNNDADGNDHEDEEEDKTSAFYLRHQNRALATELKSLQHAVIDLKEERDARRRECYKCIQALHSLQASWTAMETALQQHIPNGVTSSGTYRGFSSDEKDPERMPPSTGNDDSVEWTLALHKALENLGRHSITMDVEAQSDISGIAPGSKRKRKLQQYEQESSIDASDDVLESSGVGEMQIATNIASRATVLQEWIWKGLSSSNGIAKDPALIVAELEKSCALAEAQKQTLEVQVTELAASRRETAARERRIRRNVYRFAAGMLTSEQVITTIETDEEISAEVEIERQNRMKLEQLQTQNDQLSSMMSENAMKGIHMDSSGNDDNFQTKMSQVHADALIKQIADLEDEVSSLKTAVSDLNGILKKKEERISELCIKQLSDADAAKLQKLDSTCAKLKQATDKVEVLEVSLTETRSNWAQALGNEKTALASIDEMMNKFNKRWSELTEKFPPEPDAGNSNSAEREKKGQGGSLDKLVEQSKQIIELQHKLDQALENVRQAESTRSSLKEALIMNGSLQSKLEEIKAKYAMVQAARNNPVNSSSRPSQSASNPEVPLAVATKDKFFDVSGMSTPRDKESVAIGSTSEKELGSGSGINNVKAEKLHRDYRRARKDLAAMTASKEAAKAKLERSEKERESLAESNARLLKQITEKDDVNAKSLSTILYLKGQTDILMAEKNILEQQTKTAGQMALAARLATNAKERVADEVSKEMKALEARVERLDDELAAVKAENDRLVVELSEVHGKMAMENSELKNARKRIDDLIVENEEQRERTLDLETAFAKANRESREAKSKLQILKNSKENTVTNVGSSNPVGLCSSSGSSFTVEQLNTQISVLKRRLACPVCHERDKQCIIMRCRHMHCQQCVDDQISNRSRKCPTCNNKFSEKDVEDIWLNT